MLLRVTHTRSNITKQPDGIHIVAGELIKQTSELFYLYSISMFRSTPEKEISWTMHIQNIPGSYKALIHPHFGLSDHTISYHQARFASNQAVWLNAGFSPFI